MVFKAIIAPYQCYLYEAMVSKQQQYFTVDSTDCKGKSVSILCQAA